MLTAIPACESLIHRQMEAHGCIKFHGNSCGFAVFDKPVFYKMDCCTKFNTNRMNKLKKDKC